MKEITDKQIDDLARLSALSLTTEEKTKMKTDIAQILTFVDQIESVNTLNSSIAQKTLNLDNLRTNEVVESISNEKALANAPAKENGTFVISKVVD